MIFGGAVMMSALVGTSAQMVTLASTFDPPPSGGSGGDPAARLRAALCFGGGAGLALQLVGEFLGVRVQEVPYLGIAGAARLRGVEVENQRLFLQTHRFLAAQQYAVGALVGNHLDGSAAFGRRAGALVQRIEGPDHLRGAGILQRDHLDRLVAAFIHALDDLHDARHVAGAIRDDQHVAALVGREVALLGYQRAQEGHELLRADVLHGDDLRDDLVRGGTHARRQIERGGLPHVGVGDDLDDLSRRHRGIPVHLKHGEERLIEGLRRHRRRRQHGYLGIDARIDDEVLAGHLADRLDDLIDVRVFVVRRDGRPFLSITSPRRHLRRSGRRGPCRRRQQDRHRTGGKRQARPGGSRECAWGRE